MKVKLKTQISGTRNGEDWPARGEVISLPDAEAASLCASGLAEPVTDDKVEKAIAPEPEKRAEPPVKKTAAPVPEKRTAKKPAAPPAN